jgi:hypothetical protein
MTDSTAADARIQESVFAFLADRQYILGFIGSIRMQRRFFSKATAR